MSLVILLSLLMTGCQNDPSETSGGETPSQTQTIQNKEDTPSKDDVPKPAPEIAEFTKKYLEAYEGEENAVIQVYFSDKNEIPSEVFNKIRTINIDIRPDKEYESETYYTLFINCQDNSLYQIRTHYNDFSIKTEDVFYMAKGDAFLIPQDKVNMNNSQVSVNGKDGKFVEVNNQHAWFNLEEMNEMGLLDKKPMLHFVYMWQKEPINSILHQEFNFYPTEYIKSWGREDLDGDKKEELIYFQDTFEYFKEGASESTVIQGRLIIDDREYPFEELEHFFEGDVELYDKGLRNIEIIDLDESDSYKEIVLRKAPQINPIGEYAMIFRYDKGELQFLGHFYSDWEDNIASLTDSKEKTITIREEYRDFVMNYYNTVVYKLNGNQIEPVLKKKQDMFLNDQKLTLTTLKPLNLYESPDAQQTNEVLNPGSILLFLETDSGSWAKVKDFETGKTGYLKFENTSEEEYGWQMYGQPELGDPYYIFFNLPAWG